MLPSLNLLDGPDLFNLSKPGIFSQMTVKKKIISALIHQYIGCHSLKLYSNTVQQLKVYNYFIVNINVILIST